MKLYSYDEEGEKHRDDDLVLKIESMWANKNEEGYDEGEIVLDENYCDGEYTILFVESSCNYFEMIKRMTGVDLQENEN